MDPVMFNNLLNMIQTVLLALIAAWSHKAANTVEDRRMHSDATDPDD